MHIRPVLILDSTIHAAKVMGVYIHQGNHEAWKFVLPRASMHSQHQIGEILYRQILHAHAHRNKLKCEFRYRYAILLPFLYQLLM